MIKFKDNKHSDGSKWVDIEWNGQFIAGWDKKASGWDKIPEEVHGLLREMMKEIWVHGKNTGSMQRLNDIQEVLGIHKG